MSGNSSDCLFVIIPELYQADKGYELSTIWPGLVGVYPTGFFCGHDIELAIEFANDINRDRGHVPEFTRKVLETVAGLSDIRFFNA